MFIRVHSWFKLLPAIAIIARGIGGSLALPIPHVRFVLFGATIHTRTPQQRSQTNYIECREDFSDTQRFGPKRHNRRGSFGARAILRGKATDRKRPKTPSGSVSPSLSTPAAAMFSLFLTAPIRRWPMPTCLNPIARPIRSIGPEIVAQQSQFGLGNAPLICHNRGL